MLQKLRQYSFFTKEADLPKSQRIKRFLFGLGIIVLWGIVSIGLGESGLILIEYLDKGKFGFIVKPLVPLTILPIIIYSLILSLVGLNLNWSPKDYINTVKQHFDF